MGELIYVVTDGEIELVRELSGGGEELDAFEPFLLGQFDFPHEGVQMTDEARHDLLETRIGGFFQPRHDGVGQVGFGEVSHGLLWQET